MDTLTHAMPIWLLVADYVLGAIMWTLVGRAAMNVFLPLDSPFFFMRVFVKMTDPILKLFKPITFEFLAEPVIPLYVAWYFYMFRFYVMPWLLGYSVLGMLSFPLESDIAQGIYAIGKWLF